MGERRNEGGRLLRVGKLTKAGIARQLGVSRAASGYLTDRWTWVRVCELIKKEFGVWYHPKSIKRVPDKLGYSVQKPLPRAAEQDEKLVKAWLAKDCPG